MVGQFVNITAQLLHVRNDMAVHFVNMKNTKVNALIVMDQGFVKQDTSHSTLAVGREAIVNMVVSVRIALLICFPTTPKPQTSRSNQKN